MNEKLKIILIILAVLLLGSIVLIYINNKVNNNGNYTNNELAIENSFINNSTETIDYNVESEKKSMENKKIKLTINEEELTATLVENSSTKALLEKLSNGNITIDMHDYSNFEKVGDLGFYLPRNDESIDTDYGDLILYQGNSFVIYYDANSWNFTRLGKIDNITQDELKRILGDKNVVVTMSLY